MARAFVTFGGRQVDISSLATAKDKPLQAKDVSSLTDAEHLAVAQLFETIIPEKAREAVIAAEAAKFKGLEKYFGTGVFSQAVSSLDGLVVGVPLTEVSFSNHKARLLVREGSYQLPILAFPNVSQEMLLGAVSEILSYIPDYERQVGSADAECRSAADAVSKSQKALEAFAEQRRVLETRMDSHRELARNKDGKSSYHQSVAHSLSTDIGALDARIGIETGSARALEFVKAAAEAKLARVKSLLKPFGNPASLEELAAELAESTFKLRNAGLIQSAVPASGIHLAVSYQHTSFWANKRTPAVIVGLVLAAAAIGAAVLPGRLPISRQAVENAPVWGEPLSGAELNALSAYADTAEINLWGSAGTVPYYELPDLAALLSRGVQVKGVNRVGDGKTLYFSARKNDGKEWFYAVVSPDASVESLKKSLGVGFDKALVMGRWYELNGAELVEVDPTADCSGDGGTFALSFGPDEVKGVSCVYQFALPQSSDRLVETALAKGGLIVDWSEATPEGQKRKGRTVYQNSARSSFEVENVGNVVFLRAAAGGTDVADTYVRSVSGFLALDAAPGEGRRPYGHLTTVMTPLVTFDDAHAELSKQQAVAGQ